jgi:hypothetical protein
MTVIVHSSKRCAVCGAESKHPVVLTTISRGRAPVEDRLDAPAWFETSLEDCPHCGHVAPDVAEAYPGLAGAASADVAGLHPEAARRARVAALYAGVDLRQEGRWLARAAFHEDEHGGDGTALRRRAAPLLESGVAIGRALSPVRGATAVILAECRRILGDTAEAQLHVARGVHARPPHPTQRRQLVHTWTALRRGDRRPVTDAGAERAVDALSDEERIAFRDAFRGAPEPPPLPLVAERRWAGSWRGNVGEEWETFGADYLHADHVLPMLLARSFPILAGGVRARPSLLAAVVAAADTNRAAAVAFLQSKTLDLVSRPLPYAGPIAPLLRCLADAELLVVRDAGHTLTRFLPSLAADDRRAIVAAATEALPRVAADVSVVGVLERLIEKAGG